MLGWLFRGLVKELEPVIRDFLRDFVNFSGREIERLFNESLFPLADKLDYMAKNRISQVEELESKTIADLESLLNSADDKVRKQLERINQIREEALEDVRQTISKTDAYLENRINQISLVVMKSLNLAKNITSEFTPDRIQDRLIKPTLVEVNLLEDKLFQDANYLINRLDNLGEGLLEKIRNEFQKYARFLFPNPFHPCWKKLNIAFKMGINLSDIELYELMECLELSKLNEKTSIDEVLKIYGQLELNAVRMAALTRNARELRRRAVQDWLKYGVLCEFWHDTIKTYDYVEPIMAEHEKARELLIGKWNN